ncbi:MAG: proton-translocating NADH-quinone oxidoreductase, chain [Thermomicrobiales bacterium]|nr:proton-translocating NADH-quinone oxidoreductase, chain [Thermomicrobiales bacterium]
MAMEQYLFLVPLLPLLAFAINLLFGRVVRTGASWIASLAVFASFILSLLVFQQISATGEPFRQDLYTWIQAGDFHIGINLFVDQLTAVMLIVVTSVGFLVHVYSRGYMQGDPGFARFFAYLPFFVFSMLMLVLADNFLLLFFFWEGVGLASYLLIGFWFTRRSASSAAQKAFIVNRIGDLAFGLGLIWIFYQFGTMEFQEVFAQVPEAPVAVLTGIALLLFGGAAGKSAQFPLHVWLPDAMEGPTPVSALIHAATMVTAGIYLIVRAHVFYENAPTAMLVVALIGAFTSFMAATIAVAQNDIKRVIAYSTLSQLGYMAMGAGVGAFIPAIFHLVTHAFFKGCLFLGAGSVIHGMHEEQNIQNMGGLRRWMPLTFWTFLAASLANAGLIPFAGFWSKDEIILGAWITDQIPVTIGQILAVVGLVTAFFTAYYMFRLVFLVFTGEPRFNPAEVHPHESPLSMVAPLVLLAIPSVVLGFWIGWPPEAGAIHTFLEPVFADAEEGTSEGDVVASLYMVQDESHAEGEEGAAAEHHVSNETIIAFGVASTIAALAGIGLAYATYSARTIEAPEERASALYRFLRDKWRWDELYDKAIVRPLSALADGLWRVVDVRIIDGAVNGVGYGIGALSQRLRHVQTGLVTNYALAIALGMVVLVAIYLGWSSNLFR